MNARDESGTTLPEVLVTVLILGVGFAALGLGLLTAHSASALNRQQATIETILRSYAEHIKAAPYEPCTSTMIPQYDDYVLPTEYVARGYDPPTVVLAETWREATSPAVFDACPAPDDPGVQRLTIRAGWRSGETTDDLQIVKREIDP